MQQLGLNHIHKDKQICRRGGHSSLFQLTDNGGKTIHPYDFSGKYLLLSFISTAGIESRETVSLLKKSILGNEQR